jgi:AcrR family transcriptional regulator
VHLGQARERIKPSRLTPAQIPTEVGGAQDLDEVQHDDDLFHALVDTGPAIVPSSGRTAPLLLETIPSGRYSFVMSPRASMREPLLRAAATVVAERGYSALTLDAVGAATGVSKGGVLYHFPTKEALVAALLEELTTGFDAEQTTAHDADPIAPGAWTRAYVTASFTTPQDESAQLASVALLAAVGYDPSLLEPLQARYANWIERLDDDGLPGVDAHVVRLAADGLWTADLFHLAPPDPALRTRIHARLAELASASRGQ